MEAPYRESVIKAVLKFVLDAALKFLHVTLLYLLIMKEEGNMQKLALF